MADRIMIASTGSGRGKTTVSSALMHILKGKGEDIHAFKCGPDFIDPLYHESILGIPSKNLDSFFCEDDLLRASYKEGEGTINIIEACMGLYDGIGVSETASSYSVAKALHCPIILVIDAYGMGASIVAEIKGFLSMDRCGLIKAVLLNRISEGYYNTIKPYIEDSCGVKLVGYCPRMEDKKFKSRHLGLLLPGENNARAAISDIASIIEPCLDLDLIRRLAADAKDLFPAKSFARHIENNKVLSTLFHINPEKSEAGMIPKLAIARDEAFMFYYEDNIKCLELLGAEIVYFSPLHDRKLPEGIAAVYIGGGYPELHTKELSGNTSMLDGLRDFIEEGGSVYAECGGFMYLNQAIDDVPMVGIFDGNSKRQKGLRRFGYIEGSYQDLSLKGHEFHHYDVDDPGKEMEIVKASNQTAYRAVRRYKNCLAGYPHFYFPSMRT